MRHGCDGASDNGCFMTLDFAHNLSVWPLPALGNLKVVD